MENKQTNHQITTLLETTMTKIRELVDSETVIGAPINVSAELTLIPISKMAFGFASGGSDFTGKENTHIHFGGGSGAGVTVSPLGFLSINAKSEVTFIPVSGGASPSAVDSLISGIPGIITKAKELFAKNKDKVEVADEVSDKDDKKK